MVKNCFVVDDLHTCIIDLLEEQGISVTYSPDITREEILEQLPQYESLLIRSKTVIDEDFLQHAQQLKVIGRAGAGLDAIDEVAVAKRGIGLINAPEGNRTAVGEHALGMLLALMNNMVRADKQVRQRIWQREFNRGYEVSGKTVAIIGYGNMGQAFAKCLKGFDCEVIAYDNGKTDYSDAWAKEVSLEEVFERADILSLHIPLTKESKGMVDGQFWKRFKKPVWFVNTARGPIVKQADLLEALEAGIVRGAALDVLENEKMASYTADEIAVLDALAAKDSVIFTPHVGGWTFESLRKISEVLAEKLIGFGV